MLTRKLIVLALLCALLLIPSSGQSAGQPSLKKRVMQLERSNADLQARVKRLENQVIGLRDLICPQIPTC